MSDTTILTPEEQYKFDVLTKLIKKEVKSGQAAKILGVSVRQIQRLRRGVQNNGLNAVIHKLKGKQGNHCMDPVIKMNALQFIKEKYPDFKPTFAAEKLADRHGITVSAETTRRWMTEKGLWKTRKQKHAVYHSWRPRKDYYGELQQFDGSYHLWFENRYVDKQDTSIEVCLLASIDDATGRITQATFGTNEGIHAVFTFWKAYVQETGKPVHIYLDKFSTYKINHKAAVDNKELITQFERAMLLLDIDLITAHSPEAKGRVERLFGTLQDRLVKEMRLRNINTPKEGNRFLRDIFIPAFNNRFAVVPTKEGDVHRSLLLSEKERIDHIFSVKDTRRVNLDFTIQFKNNWYQLTEIQPTTVRPLMTVLLETWLDGAIHIMLKEHELAYMVLPEKPKKQRIKQPIILTTHTLNYKPPPNHPWRNRILPPKK
jgi:hypothetical protein